MERDAGPTQRPGGPTGGFDELMGLELKEASAQRVVAAVPVTPRLHQVFGLVHGGVYAAVAETVASVGATYAAAGAALAAGEEVVPTPEDPTGGIRVVGLSNHTDFLRPVRDGELRAEATPVTTGRTTQLWQVEITDGGGRRVAHSTVRLLRLTTG